MSEFIRGTAIKTTAVLSSAPSSVTITVLDKNENIKVNAQAMNVVSGTTYSYTFQTLNTWLAGTLYIIIKATTSGYITKIQDEVMLVDAQDGG